MMVHAETSEYLLTAEAARIWGVSPAAVRREADLGRLPHVRTPSGTRLYRRADVERRAQERAARRGAAA